MRPRWPLRKPPPRAHREGSRSAPKCRRSSGQSPLVIKQLPVIGGAEWLLEAGGAVSADHQQASRQPGGPIATHAVAALAKRLRDSRRHALSGEPRQLASQSVGLLALDIQAHSVYQSTMDRKHSTQRIRRVNALDQNRATAAEPRTLR